MNSLILKFEEPSCCDLNLAGGKGANLGRLTQAGFVVPPGFCLSTQAYAEFLASAGLDQTIQGMLSSIDYGQPAALEKITQGIRELFAKTPMPPTIRDAIIAAYHAIGADSFVAIRSSGTAEDLEGASFAGLHDTYLDIRGDDAVIDAIQRCWASLWTARATAYRHSKGFAHNEVSLCVVVQTMVASEVSGVMFTGNPMTAATDEITINASWGLGEAIVSGIITPDEFTVKAITMAIVERNVGEKALRIDRVQQGGTITTDVHASDRARPSLSDEQIQKLARLGLKVQEYYGGFPQDIEWALHNNNFYLLQSRPVTGVDFSWDADVTSWQKMPEDEEVIWTKAGSEEWWTGAISPLMFSYRATLWQRVHDHLARVMELEPDVWFWKFHRSEAYFNTRVQRQLVERACPPAFRDPMLAQLPPDIHDDVKKTPFSLWRHVRNYLKVELMYPTQSFTRWIKSFDQLAPMEIEKGRKLLKCDLTELTDDELRRHILNCIEFEYYYYPELWLPFWIFSRDMAGVLAMMVGKWYDGDNAFAVVELMSGVPKRTITQRENHLLWELSEEIRRSPELKTAFEAHEGASFLAAIKGTAAGDAYLANYRGYVNEFGHRGSADRDLYFPKRAEDPMIDYRSIKALLSVAESVDPLINEERVNARRDVVRQEVIESMKKKPFGFLRAELFKFVHDYVLSFLMARDNEREIADFGTYAIKLGCIEISRRLIKRVVLDAEDDYVFLTKEELFTLLDGDLRRLPLMRAKIAARRKNFTDFLRKKVRLPDYIYRNKAINLSAEAGVAKDGVFQGVGTSRGCVTGRARVLNGPEEIGRVKHGEIVICHATDPGWTPVFMVISGLVLETGGVLAHGSCLSREYGLPCVQVARATELIPDGSMVTIDGDTGTVTIEETASTAAQALEPVPA